MTTPLDIVAAAVHAAQCGTVEQVAYDTAQVAVNALADERVVDNAVGALRDANWGETGDLTGRPYTIDDSDLREIVRVVLRSVGEA